GVSGRVAVRGRGTRRGHSEIHRRRAAHSVQRSQALGVARSQSHAPQHAATQRDACPPTMAIHEFFPTLVYTAPLQRAGARAFNRQLLKECRQLREDDAAGRRWCAHNYPGGYTSYGSAHRMQRVSPTFEALQRKLERHVRAFAAAVQWDLAGRELSMTDCWINIMPRRTVHGLHLHPLSTLSGTYYVQVP